MTDLFDFKPASRAYAVMGNPVAHSKSPQIHQMFGSQCGVALSYERVQVDIGGFAQAVSHFAAHDGAGLNITVPFKLEAWELCNTAPNVLSHRATLAQAVNTLKFESDGSVFGENTDGLGIARDIENNLGCQLSGKRVLILGAGGAVRGVLGPLVDCDPGAITITNRTPEKATALATHFNEQGYSKVFAVSLDRIEKQYDLVINGTAASLGGKLPQVDGTCIGPNTLAYDMMYANEPTLFMKWALDYGANAVSDGLGMLVEQAAESFSVWHGKRPDTAPVISALRKA